MREYIDNVVNPLLLEKGLNASSCSLTSKKHKAAREKLAHLTFFRRLTPAQMKSVKPGQELIETVAFDTPSLDTFHEINEELGSIYESYTKKMQLISRFRVLKIEQVMKKVDNKHREVEIEMDMKEKQLEELKMQELQQASVGVTRTKKAQTPRAKKTANPVAAMNSTQKIGQQRILAQSPKMSGSKDEYLGTPHFAQPSSTTIQHQ